MPKVTTTLNGGVKKRGDTANGSRRRALSAHQTKLAARLESGQFRMLNEALYTSSGADARKIFDITTTTTTDSGTDGQELFRVYHSGFSAQAARWPRNPLDAVIRALKTPAVFARNSVVADFGCGEARLSLECSAAHTVHSFDLVSVNPRVLACDMSNVPLESASVDVAVFCLALMGTDYAAALAEARRVLRVGGTLLIAEVSSRFEGVGVNAFATSVEKLGYKRINRHKFLSEAAGDVKGNTSNAKGGKRRKGKRRRKTPQSEEGNKGNQGNEQAGRAFFEHFVFEAVEKQDTIVDWKKAGLPALKPCIYKRR